MLTKGDITTYIGTVAAVFAAIGVVWKKLKKKIDYVDLRSDGWEVKFRVSQEAEAKAKENTAALKGELAGRDFEHDREKREK